jgi:hypothetical protein
MTRARAKSTVGPPAGSPAARARPPLARSPALSLCSSSSVMLRALTLISVAARSKLSAAAGRVSQRNPLTCASRLLRERSSWNSWLAGAPRCACGERPSERLSSAHAWFAYSARTLDSDVFKLMTMAIDDCNVRDLPDAYSYNVSSGFCFPNFVGGPPATTLQTESYYFA